ncbi:MAG: hypothetical protein J5715_02745 [Clostridiales bacterium]|nr:hypothetical protein [Clostridiales bacterium]
MSSPSYEPHFSAEHLARKIFYLRNKLDSLPRGYVVRRHNREYVRINGLSGIVERSINTSEGMQLLNAVNEYNKTMRELKNAQDEWTKYYRNVTLEQPKPVNRSLPIPECMTLAYYENPPDIKNDYKILTPYPFDDLILRSRFEYIAAETFKEMGIPFKYEIPVITPAGVLFPDMIVPVPERGRCVGFEFCGKSGEHKYMTNNSNKMINYNDAGLVINHDIIFVFGGENWLPPISEIKNAIIFGIENC